MKKAILFVSALLCLCVAATGFAGDGSWERVQKKGELVIGLDDTFAPMGFRKDDGTLVGFDVDAAEALGERLGIDIAWQPTAWDGVIHSLNAKKFDCIWNGMTITEERAAKVDFTEPYIMDGQIVVVQFENDAVTDFADLGGTTVGVQKGSSAVEAVEDLPKAPETVKEYPSNNNALLDLEAGRLAAVIVDNVAGRYAIATRPGTFKVLPGFVTKEPFGIAFRKADDSLRMKVQQALDAMVEDGTLAEISRKWFGEDITNPAKW
ncbi:amino acid ABC transporter substrate-binding protein [Desulfohalobium retbaense]|uniref:Extracellular solute-binding protein family 3 n=1 Tax=Desulfohalobium retbaense (strain ATCC 49708 / DSM 5692 / JCM 16813 / HR100) TaxID=485915 RepID=C8X2D5_DESRD|nr:amino acid ABC transporter substrate-binding protein [Desulfohalobium retbaense]ACV68582.1 extracellular solute-binding protein family 3 [Desulfohalobium retbaense DSM 5692]